MTNPFQVRWTSVGNTLCLGHWEIHYNNTLLQLPEDRLEKDMGTYGIYNFMDPDDPLYTEGDKEDDWIVANVDWLADVFEKHNVPIDEEHFRFFYHAVNAEDWRCGSCGGC
ncbi:hypothetical protein C942_02673 [Photobacterium marinum]|uniref:Uncharacterized protein n=1 Tax=Photobacterium marinum TaxID=1056511 RepID=L8JEA4_9GAMM|nr:hypothetical protein [Photobacterium marinum]ELR67165.1 hypothetical protein C942_02673 [Photobacterium marinum]